jgi:hypothetical protein
MVNLFVVGSTPTITNGGQENGILALQPYNLKPFREKGKERKE